MTGGPSIGIPGLLHNGCCDRTNVRRRWSFPVNMVFTDGGGAWELRIVRLSGVCRDAVMARIPAVRIVLGRGGTRVPLFVGILV